MANANLFSAFDFRELVSGRRTGAVAAVLRSMLRVLEIPYTFEVRRRNRAFDLGRRIPESGGCPVVSVGNITLGGTGKTPLVEWIARWLSARGVCTAVVSRGYKAGENPLNDEARELAQRLPEVRHVLDADRVAAARRAIAEYRAQAIVLDDGFQHRRLHRDLDIVLIDALEPFGYGHVFPRGLLREPLEGLARADLVVLTRANLVEAAVRERIQSAVARWAPRAGWIECRHQPQMLRSGDGRQAPLEQLAGKRVAAFCGLGNPAGFRRTLEELNVEVAAWREFPDHHHFGKNDFAELAELLQCSSASALVCTHKDLVKIDRAEIAGRELWAVLIGMEFMAGRELLEQRLAQLLPGRFTLSDAI